MPRNKSILNSTFLFGGNPGKSSLNTSGKSRTIIISVIAVFSFFVSITYVKNGVHPLVRHFLAFTIIMIPDVTLLLLAYTMNGYLPGGLMHTIFLLHKIPVSFHPTSPCPELCQILFNSKGNNSSWNSFSFKLMVMFSNLLLIVRFLPPATSTIIGVLSVYGDNLSLLPNSCDIKKWSAPESNKFLAVIWLLGMYLKQR